MKSLNIAATGMLAQQRNVEVISNNIANLNTVGYKRQRAEFQDLLYQTIERAGAIDERTGTIDPTGIQIGTGVRTGSIYRILEQGNVSETGNPFDLAISGRGYFRIELPDGIDGYTRAGNFAVSPTGELVTGDGNRVLPNIQIPEASTGVVISDDGIVQARIPGETTLRDLGRLDLVTFLNEAGLEALGGNLFIETEASGQPLLGQPGDPGFGTMLQGFVETSNVDPVQEITTLIAAQRAYEMNARVIEASDEILATNANLQR